MDKIIELLGLLPVWYVVESIPYESDMWSNGMSYQEALDEVADYRGDETVSIVIDWDSVKTQSENGKL